MGMGLKKTFSLISEYSVKGFSVQTVYIVTHLNHMSSAYLFSLVTGQKQMTNKVGRCR